MNIEAVWLRLDGHHLCADLDGERLLLSADLSSNTLVTRTGLLIDGEWLERGEPLVVYDKYTGEPIAELREAGAVEADAAVGGASPGSRA